MAWFETWFDSPYYDLLYKKRDDMEAQNLVAALLSQIQLPPNAKVLDVGCGTGRHGAAFVNRGYHYTGLDLSKRSITLAKERALPHANFHVGDMRDFQINQQFDLAVNLFTSFGYFENPADNGLALSNVRAHLKPHGQYVVDFFNAQQVINNLVKAETKIVNDINFQITRTLENGFIVKRIKFQDNGQDFEFEEKVQALDQNTLCHLLKENGFDVETIAGDYQLSPFDQESSERLIILSSRR